jgi:hypothetical protein
MPASDPAGWRYWDRVRGTRVTMIDREVLGRRLLEIVLYDKSPRRQQADLG